MDRATLTRMQIRVVLTVFRSEIARLGSRYAEGTPDEAEQRLRSRSLELLDDARAKLDGEAPVHPDLLAEVQAARDEVSGEGLAVLGPTISPGSRGDRPG